MFEQLGLIGCGLMGGSFALALKRAGLVKRVVGYSKSPATSERARLLGVIDAHATSAQLAVSGCDVVLIAVPVAATEASFTSIQPLITPDMLVMDVGSTKCDVMDAAKRTLGEQIGSFVPAHPIAGKEVSGVDHADADLYTGKQVILTPTDLTWPEPLEKARALWTALGCKVSQMSPQAHDAAYAAVSHLPHLLAFALMNAISGQTEGKDFLALAGPGFRDFSRIAASDPHVWRDILISNRDELLKQTRLFNNSLQALELMISSGRSDALEGLIRQASDARAGWRMNQTTK